nr:MAG TPA: hypothetical protein [Caudoviricetes sp.]
MKLVYRDVSRSLQDLQLLRLPSNHTKPNKHHGKFLL